MSRGYHRRLSTQISLSVFRNPTRFPIDTTPLPPLKPPHLPCVTTSLAGPTLDESPLLSLIGERNAWTTVGILIVS